MLTSDPAERLYTLGLYAVFALLASNAVLPHLRTPYPSALPLLSEQAVPSHAWLPTEAELEADDRRDAAVEKAVRQYRHYGLDADLAGAIYDAALVHRIDTDMAFGLVRAESGFDPAATSPVGAIGLAQVMPATAREMYPGISVSRLGDPQTNLDLGFRYLRWLLVKYDGNRHLALTAYNRGPGTVDRVLAKGGNPDNGYAALVARER